jgi:hypothetical protein
MLRRRSSPGLCRSCINGGREESGGWRIALRPPSPTRAGRIYRRLSDLIKLRPCTTRGKCRWAVRRRCARTPPGSTSKLGFRRGEVWATEQDPRARPSARTRATVIEWLRYLDASNGYRSLDISTWLRLVTPLRARRASFGDALRPARTWSMHGEGGVTRNCLSTHLSRQVRLASITMDTVRDYSLDTELPPWRQRGRPKRIPPYEH